MNNCIQEKEYLSTILKVLEWQVSNSIHYILWMNMTHLPNHDHLVMWIE